MINVTNIFRALLFLSPIVVASDINMDVFDLIFFQLGAMILFATSLIDTKKRELPQWVGRIIFALFALCLFNLYNFKCDHIVLMNTINLFLAIMAFNIVYTHCDKNIDVVKPIAYAFMINAILFSLQRMGMDPVYDTPSYGFIGNAARWGIYSALVTPFIPLWLIIAGLWAVVYTHSYTMLIPIVLMVFLKANSVKKKILAGVIALGIAFFIKDHIINQFGIRIKDLWMPVLNAYFDHPLTGIGFGRTHLISENIGVYCNSYLQFVVGMGALGLVWIGYALKAIKSNLTINLGLLSLLFIMFIEYPIEIPRFWFTVMAILVIALLKNQRGIA